MSLRAYHKARGEIRKKLFMIYSMLELIIEMSDLLS